MDDRIRIAAIIQLVAGIVNLTIVSWVSFLFWIYVGGLFSMVVMAICTLGLCPLPVGMVCGIAGALIGLMGIAEMVSGVAALARPDPPKTPLQVVAGLGLANVFLANPVSVVAGAVVLALTMGPEPEPTVIDAEP
ncbi:MAG: hypothetical protein R3F61_24630 [Myxococcota bacterium]